MASRISDSTCSRVASAATRPGRSRAYAEQSASSPPSITIRYRRSVIGSHRYHDHEVGRAPAMVAGNKPPCEAGAAVRAAHTTVMRSLAKAA